MNRALFFPNEILNDRLYLAESDRRAQHIQRILRANVGDKVLVGIVNGPRGTAVVESVDAFQTVLHIEELNLPPDKLLPVTLLLGHPRPIVLRRILKDAVTSGFARIHIIRGELCERSYMESNIWKDEDALQELLVLGAEQAGGSRIPELRRFWSLERRLQEEDVKDSSCRILLHPGHSDARELCELAGAIRRSAQVTIAVGSERGWSDTEVQQMVHSGFLPVSLGNRILRTETAVQWAIAQLASLVSA